ncbi:IS66 family insertion sequence element accessory protein TnpB [Neomoorella thermoacetica]|uniref:IS66 family insertion sequence element accessory protein TnpB n=1 Tax=Neomoorella thermoacetica TaxID=1525 RepID=UPI003255CDDC
MLNEAGIDRVYLACGATDLRKSIDGLAVLVKEGFERKRKITPTYHRGGGKNKLNYSSGKQEVEFPTTAGVDPGHLYP